MDGLHMNSGSVLINTKRHGARKQNRNLSANGSFECSKQSILSSMDKFVRTVQSMHGTILVPSRLRDMRLRPRLPDCQITMLAASSNTGGIRLNGLKPSSMNQTGQLKTKSLNSSSNHSHFHHHLHHHLLHNHHLQDYHLGYHPSYHSSSTSNSTNSFDSSSIAFNSRLNYDPAEIPSALMNADLYNFYSMLYDVKQQLLWGPASGQSTIFTNYNTNSDLNQSNTRFMMEKSSLHQLNSTMANCNLNNSDNSSIVQLANQTHSNSLSKENRAESTCSSGYSSNSSTRNSTTNLSFIAQCNSPTSIASNCSTTNSPITACASSSPTSPFVQSSVSCESPVVSRQCLQEDVKINDSAVSSSSLTTNCLSSCASSDNSSESGVKLVDSTQSKTPQSDSDLESEMESDSILTDRTSEQITDQTQLLASAFRHHLQALHTILDQLTHSAEYLSRNYELDLGEDNC